MCRVIFTAEDLEDNPTQFAVGLEECGEVFSVEYDDEQGNAPDFSSLPEPTCPEVTAHDTKQCTFVRTLGLFVGKASPAKPWENGGKCRD